jgi:hypothetical protein
LSRVRRKAQGWNFRWSLKKAENFEVPDFSSILDINGMMMSKSLWEGFRRGFSFGLGSSHAGDSCVSGSGKPQFGGMTMPNFRGMREYRHARLAELSPFQAATLRLGGSFVIYSVIIRRKRIPSPS